MIDRVGGRILGPLKAVTLVFLAAAAMPCAHVGTKGGREMVLRGRDGQLQQVAKRRPWWDEGRQIAILQPTSLQRVVANKQGQFPVPWLIVVRASERPLAQLEVRVLESSQGGSEVPIYSSGLILVSAGEPVPGDENHPAADRMAFSGDAHVPRVGLNAGWYRLEATFRGEGGAVLAEAGQRFRVMAATANERASYVQPPWLKPPMAVADHRAERSRTNVSARDKPAEGRPAKPVDLRAMVIEEFGEVCPASAPCGITGVPSLINPSKIAFDRGRGLIRWEDGSPYEDETRISFVDRRGERRVLQTLARRTEEASLSGLILPDEARDGITVVLEERGFLGCVSPDGTCAAREPLVVESRIVIEKPVPVEKTMKLRGPRQTGAAAIIKPMNVEFAKFCSANVQCRVDWQVEVIGPEAAGGTLVMMLTDANGSVDLANSTSRVVEDGVRRYDGAFTLSSFGKYYALAVLQDDDPSTNDFTARKAFEVVERGEWKEGKGIVRGPGGKVVPGKGRTIERKERDRALGQCARVCGVARGLDTIEGISDLLYDLQSPAAEQGKSWVDECRECLADRVPDGVKRLAELVEKYGLECRPFPVDYLADAVLEADPMTDCDGNNNSPPDYKLVLNDPSAGATFSERATIVSLKTEGEECVPIPQDEDEVACPAFKLYAPQNCMDMSRSMLSDKEWLYVWERGMVDGVLRCPIVESAPKWIRVNVDYCNERDPGTIGSAGWTWSERVENGPRLEWTAGNNYIGTRIKFQELASDGAPVGQEGSLDILAPEGSVLFSASTMRRGRLYRARLYSLGQRQDCTFVEGREFKELYIAYGFKGDFTQYVDCYSVRSHTDLSRSDLDQDGLDDMAEVCYALLHAPIIYQNRQTSCTLEDACFPLFTESVDWACRHSMHSIHEFVRDSFLTVQYREDLSPDAFCHYCDTRVPNADCQPVAEGARSYCCDSDGLDGISGCLHQDLDYQVGRLDDWVAPAEYGREWVLEEGGVNRTMWINTQVMVGLSDVYINQEKKDDNFTVNLNLSNSRRLVVESSPPLYFHATRRSNPCYQNVECEAGQRGAEHVVDIGYFVFFNHDHLGDSQICGDFNVWHEGDVEGTVLRVEHKSGGRPVGANFRAHTGGHYASARVMQWDGNRYKVWIGSPGHGSYNYGHGAYLAVAKEDVFQGYVAYFDAPDYDHGVPFDYFLSSAQNLGEVGGNAKSWVAEHVPARKADGNPSGFAWADYKFMVGDYWRDYQAFSVDIRKPAPSLPWWGVIADCGDNPWCGVFCSGDPLCGVYPYCADDLLCHYLPDCGDDDGCPDDAGIRSAWKTFYDGRDGSEELEAAGDCNDSTPAPTDRFEFGNCDDKDTMWGAIPLFEHAWIPWSDWKTACGGAGEDP